MAEASTPVYANSTANPYPSDKAALVKILSEQIGKPVLFRQTLESMYAAGATTFLEVGPGSVLTNLVRHSLPADKITAIALDDKHGNGTTSLLCAIGQLAVSGIDVSIGSLFEGLPAPVARVKPGKHAVKLLGSNFQKPYPPQDGQASVPNLTDQGATAMSAAPLSDAARVSQTTNSTGAVLSAESTQENRPAGKAGPAELNGASQARHPHNTAQTFRKPLALHVTPHQSSTVAKSTMAMQDQPSGTNGAAQSLQSRSVSNTAQPDKVTDESSVQKAPVANTLQQALFNNVSVVHSEYMAALTEAHQSYLRVAAGLIDGANGTALSMPADQAVSTNHKQSLPDNDTSAVTSASVAATSLNGHSNLNGALIKTTGSSPEISTDVEQAPKVAPASTDNHAIPSPSINNNSVNGTAHNGTAHNSTAHNGAAQPRVNADLVRTLIAEKTGYPAEMIEDDMDLSGELGIDSIKQVEVLSALRIQVPEIKDVGTADIGQLRTIRQIADFFG